MTIVTLMTYIAIVALALTLYMTLVSKIHKSWLMSFAQNFAGVLFIFSGWVKAVDPMGTAIKMQDYFAEFEATFSGTAMSFIAPVFPLFSSYALTFAIFMIILEIVLGIMLILGDRPKLTAWLFFLIVVFFTVLTGFTFLTGYVPVDQNFFNFSSWTAFKATNMRVTDCGCFGDFIKLDPRTSFLKDIFLMVPALYFLLRSKDMHSLFTQKTRNLTVLLSTLFLIFYCFYNFYWNEPHVDFRPFKNNANIAEIMHNEKAAANAVQVIAMKMKNKSTGEIKEIPYADYLKNLNEYSENYETIEQIKTEPVIEATKVSDFSITDFDGDEKADLFINNPEPHLMVQIYHAEYQAIPEKIMVRDSVYTNDTTVVSKDSITVVRVLKDVTEKEVMHYKIIWNPDFIEIMKSVIKPLMDNAAKDKIKLSVVISGIDQEKADLLAKETGIITDYYTADEKLLKTIMRSNPGIVLWKNGILLHKWHYKKLPSWDQIKQEYLK
ncbi:MAG TPA: DoxX family protein [Saprospiraceae bacterium]|nr:DoxX family protein [Saprospiraceae bacterium]